MSSAKPTGPRHNVDALQRRANVRRAVEQYLSRQQEEITRLRAHAEALALALEHVASVDAGVLCLADAWTRADAALAAYRRDYPRAPND